MNKAQVIVVQPGYAIWEKAKEAQRADGTITIIKSSCNIIVDTGLPKDKDIILQFLTAQGMSPEDISYVICTHGDADHTSNNNLFPQAKLIVGFDIYTDDVATFFTQELVIDDNVKIVGMTGHDERSIGVLASTEEGVVAITGDLFEYERDWKDVANWIAFSKNPEEQIRNRDKVWNLADYIVPGHGDMFKVDKSIQLSREETKALKGILAVNNVYGDTTTAEEFEG